MVAWFDAARATRTESQCSSIPQRFCRTSRSTNTRSPTVQRTRRLHQIISPAKTSTDFSRDFSSAISGFRSLCGRQQRSFMKPSRSIGPAFWNLSLGAGSRLRTLAFARKSLRGIYGASNPGPMLWGERSRSRGIFQVVFLHFNPALWEQFPARDGPPDACQIGFGRPFER